MPHYINLTGLESDAVLRPFFEDFLPGYSLAKFSFPTSDFFSAETCTN